VFRINADDGARVTIDGVVVAEEMTPYRLNMLGFGLDLAAGSHTLEIDYLQTGGGSALELYWQPPGGVDGPVPPAVLRADQALASERR
jgi:hypothetical protein